MEEFVFDVFLSHSAKDKDTVREVAERLRADGLRVWFEDWEIPPDDSLSPSERARVREENGNVVTRNRLWRLILA